MSIKGKKSKNSAQNNIKVQESVPELKKIIADLQYRIDTLPVGYISRKVINGKERFYRQWREGDKLRSKYIKAGEFELVNAQIAERKQLEENLKRLEKQFAVLQILNSGNAYEFDSRKNEWQPVVAEDIFKYSPYINGESNPYLYLKWENQVIGNIDENYNVYFTAPDLNRVVSMYTSGKTFWNREEFFTFISERIPSRDRRDIEHILFKCGLNHYDVPGIARATRIINAKDLLWIAKKKNEKFEDAVTEVFESIFGRKTDLEGDSVDTPEGYNIKRYGVFNGKYGIYKKRINPLSTDVESEIAVYKLAMLMGIECCPCYRVDEDTVFSEFQYDFAKEYIVHFRRIIKEPRGEDELMNLISVRPQYFPDFAKLVALDFLTRQDDRHLSNIAVKVIDLEKKSKEKRKGQSLDELERFYPLYDNGRSLFYEDTGDTVNRALRDVPGFATSFGPKGTYLNHIETIKSMGVDYSKLLNLKSLTTKNVKSILKQSGFKDYRLDGSIEWIVKCKEYLM